MAIRYGRPATLVDYNTSTARKESGVLPRVRDLHQKPSTQGQDSGAETDKMIQFCEPTRPSAPASSLTVEAASVRDALNSYLVDEYVANRVRRALLSLHCEPDHPAMVTEERMLKRSEARLRSHLAMIWPGGTPADKQEEVLERLSMLIRIRARTYDDFEPEEQADATMSILEEGFRGVV